MLRIAKDLSLPVEIAGRRTAVFGISGSGKSNTATVIIEGLLRAGEQVVLIDPKGEGWGLLSLTNGKASNLPLVIFGEPGGHITSINESHGAKLADFVFETGQSVALSLVGFESDASERRFVATFMRQLYRRKSQSGKKTRTLVVLEEAHLFIPESQGRGHKGDLAELSGAVQRIARQGRSFGLGTLIVDQRPQDVAKRVVTQVDTVICHQLTHKLDREALSDWVKGYDVDGRGKTFLDSLASLEPGEAWVWSPAWLKIFQRVHVERRKTFDSGAAPDGSAEATKVQRAAFDLDGLRGQLDQIVEQAKANDPAVLKARIKELEEASKKQPTAVSAAAPNDKALERAKRDGARERDAEWKEKFDSSERERKRLQRFYDRTKAAIDGQDPPAVIERPAPVPVVTAPAGRSSPVPQSRSQERRFAVQSRVQVARAEGLSTTQQRIIDAMAWWASIGVDVPTVEQVAFVARINPKGGHFSNTVGPLSTQGYITRGEGTMRLTDAGRSAANAPASSPDLDDYHAGIRKVLKGGAQIRILDAVIAAGGETTTEAIGAATGIDPSGGHFSNSIGPLGTLGLIERRAGIVRPTELLFPPGLV